MIQICYLWKDSNSFSSSLQNKSYLKKTKDLNLWRKESHSSRNLRVVSTPWWSLPQCSKPLLTNWRKISIRSLDEISQCLCSLISVKIQGLIRAPLWKNKIHGSFEEVKTKNRKVQKKQNNIRKKNKPTSCPCVNSDYSHLADALPSLSCCTESVFKRFKRLPIIKCTFFSPSLQIFQ